MITPGSPTSRSANGEGWAWRWGSPDSSTDVDPESATITIGRRKDLEVTRLRLEQLAWVDQPVTDDVLIQYRAHGHAVPGRVDLSEGDPSVHFEQPQMAVAAGQTVAFYRGDEVLGGGIIAAAA